MITVLYPNSRQDSAKDSQQLSLSPTGFTLVEMMVTLVIIAILAAIAIPSYRQYTVKNAESQVQAKMRQVQTELEAWRATNLTYRGFKPRQVDSSGTVTYAYANTTPANTKIFVPDSTNPKYTITLLDGGDQTTSLVPTSTTTIDLTGHPNGWRMLAEPNTDLTRYGAKRMLLNSKGLACKDLTLDINATTCSGADTW